MTIIPFNREHLHRLVIQKRQIGLEELSSSEMAKVLENGESYTVIDGDEVIACAGIVEVNHGRGIGWAYLAENIGARMLMVTRAIRKYLPLCSRFHRIEIQVDCDFPQGHRWAKLLGFELEAERMRGFTPDKRDCALYAMVIT